MISIIIPAYKATKYIDECIFSIEGSVEHEILIGVDYCKETFIHLKNIPNIKLFYFTENVGPFVIKNTLINAAKYENILFFDSDDILHDGMLDVIAKQLEDVDYLKLNYINFHNKKIMNGHKMNDAVIAIKKNVFNSLNGFYPWRCGADTEFTYRLEYNKYKTKTFTDFCYHRRIHDENLTIKKETTHGSPIRQSYVAIINKNIQAKNWPNPTTKTIQDYVKN
jgi:glycosyltransferase involved in cell wall biosynthesis